jgi:hypothetical protein
LFVSRLRTRLALDVAEDAPDVIGQKPEPLPVRRKKTAE